MVIIGYGIAAVIVLVLLVVFNVRAASKRSGEGKVAEKKESPVPEDQGPVREAARPEDVAMPATAETVVPERAGKSDLDYRNAMRDLKMGAGQAREAAERGKAAAKMSDSDYRNAMRNFRKPGDGKK